MSKIKLDGLKNEISNYKQRIDLLQNKKRELNEMIHRPSTFESDVRVYRARENEVLLEIRSLAEHLNVIEREANALEIDLANESKANREKEWLSKTPDELNEIMSLIVNDINEVNKKIENVVYQISNLELKRTKSLAVINFVDVLQDELKALRRQKALLKVDQAAGDKAHELTKAVELKRSELNKVNEVAIDAADELTVINTRIDNLKITLSCLDQNRKDLRTSYFLQSHHKVSLVYITQVNNIMASLRHMHAIESLIPQYRQPEVANRLLSRLNSQGLEIPTFDGLTKKPHGLRDLLKDLTNEINEAKTDLITKVDCGL